MHNDPKTSANQKVLWSFSESLLPKNRCGDFNQALMELGSEICTPKKPDCLRCPINDHCPTFVQGLQSSIPAPSKKIEFTDLHEAVIVVRKRVGAQTKYLVRQCGPEERWTGLWDFPRYEIASDNAENALAEELKEQTGLRATLLPTNKRIKHAVTRYRITLDCYIAESPSGRLKKNQSPTQWLSHKELANLPMSTTGRKIADSIHQLETNLLF
jgi:A/G-specific adenine glycosylase